MNAFYGLQKVVSTSNTPPSNTSSGFSMANPYRWVLTASFLVHGFVQRLNTELARDGWSGRQRIATGDDDEFDVYLAT